ncbi:Spx/MgsR family RNA polymerase-binding regulatory protein, partial [Microcoleus sp. ARI1-B5]
TVNCQLSTVNCQLSTVNCQLSTVNCPYMSIQVYGIPNCGTCKKAFQWLQDSGITYEFINTKEQPPTRETIQNWVATLGFQPMRNTSGQSYRALGDDKKKWTSEQWVEAFAKDAMLLKRPLFVKDGTAVLVGFKAEIIRERLGI